jgi:membrane-associated phospholipid phosphatase
MATNRGRGESDEEELQPLTGTKDGTPRSSPASAEAGGSKASNASPKKGGDAKASAADAVAGSTADVDSDLEVGLQATAPAQWSLCPRGSGLLEFQGYETWTPAERVAWKEGRLKDKWGVLQVSIRLPISSWKEIIAILYGYLPFLIPGWWVVWAFTSYSQNGHPRFFPTYGICIATVFALVNETVVKQVCKRVFSRQVFSRPAEAVCKHPGMPSGHVMNAYTLMVWCLWEVSQGELVHLDWLVLIGLAFGPVPWARVYNKDHTRQQVLVSAVVALIMGTFAYYIRATYYPGHSRPWDWDGYHADSLQFDGPLPNFSGEFDTQTTTRMPRWRRHRQHGVG